MREDWDKIISWFSRRDWVRARSARLRLPTALSEKGKRGFCANSPGLTVNLQRDVPCVADGVQGVKNCLEIQMTAAEHAAVRLAQVEMAQFAAYTEDRFSDR